MLNLQTQSCPVVTSGDGVADTLMTPNQESRFNGRQSFLDQMGAPQ